MQTLTIHDLPIEPISVIFSFLTEDEIESFNETTSCINGIDYLTKLRRSTDYIQNKILETLSMERYAFQPNDRIELLYGLVVGWKEDMGYHNSITETIDRLISMKMLEFFPFFCKYFSVNAKRDDFPTVFIERVMKNNHPFWMMEKFISFVPMSPTILIDLIEGFAYSEPFYRNNFQSFTSLIQRLQRFYPEDYSHKILRMKQEASIMMIKVFKTCKISFHIERFLAPGRIVELVNECIEETMKYLNDAKDEDVAFYISDFADCKLEKEKIEILLANPKEIVCVLGHVANGNYEFLAQYCKSLEGNDLLKAVYQYIPLGYRQKVFFELKALTQLEILETNNLYIYDFDCNQFCLLHKIIEDKVWLYGVWLTKFLKLEKNADLRECDLEVVAAFVPGSDVQGFLCHISKNRTKKYNGVYHRITYILERREDLNGNIQRTYGRSKENLAKFVKCFHRFIT